MSARDLLVVPVTKAQALEFVDEHHRHLFPNRAAYRFAVGVALGETLVGVAIVALPSARGLMDGRTLEVVRSTTDGTRNANSMLYGACWRAARALGWSRLITYTQDGETGASLRAAGFRVIAERPARGDWDMPSRPREPRRCSSCGEPWKTGGVARTLWEVAS